MSGSIRFNGTYSLHLETPEEKLLGLFEDEGCMFLHGFGNHSLNNTPSYPRRHNILNIASVMQHHRETHVQTWMVCETPVITQRDIFLLPVLVKCLATPLVEVTLFDGYRPSTTQLPILQLIISFLGWCEQV
jgi:hypothetical protein